MIKQFVQAQNIATDAKQAVAAKARNEEGEVASWLILAAGLAAAAFAASGSLKTLIGNLVGDVESSATN